MASCCFMFSHAYCNVCATLLNGNILFVIGAVECMDPDLEDRCQSHAQAGTNDSMPSVQFMPSSTTNSGCQNTASSAQAAPQAAANSRGANHTSSDNDVLRLHSSFALNGVVPNALHKAEASEALPNAPEPQHSPAQLAAAQRDPAQRDPAQHHAEQHDPGPLPMLASACPGWVCYAEKTHGSYILPFISTTKSPQVSHRLSSAKILMQTSHRTTVLDHCGCCCC